MTPPNPLTALAERVCKLTQACRETDYLICEAVHPFLAEQGYRRTEGDSGYYSATPLIPGAEKVGPASEYTASLDAAMTLKPKECYVDTQERYRMHRDLEYTDRSWARVETADGGKFLGEATANTVPLAIVAAILRTRAASESPLG